MQYIQLTISTADAEKQEIMIALLADYGFESFEQEETCVKAFIKELDFNDTAVTDLLQPFKVTYTSKVIEQQNWNELWESNFSPVIVDDFVGIRAHFHTPLLNVLHEIIITPKMSFGTGHHATTYSVMQLMKEVNFSHKTVFDFGTGTGILAILAEKLGAKNILAIDNDDWCVENSTENVANNYCTNITVQKGEDAFVQQPFDIVIANINKHILLQNVAALSGAVVQGGKIMLSGLLVEDEKDMLAAFSNWQHVKTLQKNGWIAILFNAA